MLLLELDHGGLYNAAAVPSTLSRACDVYVNVFSPGSVDYKITVHQGNTSKTNYPEFTKLPPSTYKII